MGLRDTAAPSDGTALHEAAAAILSVVKAIGATSILAPWQHDPHCDHLAAHRMAAVVAADCGIRRLAYPVWGWTLPPETLLPGPAPHGMRLDIAEYMANKQRAIAAHATQYSGMIDDDPGGFQLPEHLLSVFSRPYETFLTFG